MNLQGSIEMIKAIIYKEWLKTQWLIAGIAAVMAGMLFYSFLNLSKVVEFRGAEILWSTLIAKDTVLLEVFRYAPAAAGVLLALAQFLPEVQFKRLKLTLHLPVKQGVMTGCIVGYGLTVLTVFSALHAAICAILLGRWIPAELVSRITSTMLVWYLAGWAAYLWTCAICIEPTWRMRIVLVVLLAALAGLFFLSPVPEAYNSFLPWLAAYTLASAILIFGGIERFKEGVQ